MIAMLLQWFVALLSWMMQQFSKLSSTPPQQTIVEQTTIEQETEEEEEVNEEEEEENENNNQELFEQFSEQMRQGLSRKQMSKMNRKRLKTERKEKLRESVQYLNERRVKESEQWEQKLSDYELQQIEKQAKQEEEQELKRRVQQKEYDEFVHLFEVVETKDEQLQPTQNIFSKLLLQIEQETHPILHVEYLAMQCHLSVEETVKCLQELLSSEQLYGILDDQNGKFYHFTKPQLQQIQSIWKQQGRMTITQMKENLETVLLS